MNILRNLFANARKEIVKIRHARNHVIIGSEIMDRSKIFGALPNTGRWRILLAARVKARSIHATVVDTAEIRRKHKGRWRREGLPVRIRGRARVARLPHHGRI